VSVNVFEMESHEHAVIVCGEPWMVSEMALDAQLGDAEVVNAPIVTRIVDTGLMAVVQFMVTSELLPDSDREGEAVRPVAARTGSFAASRAASDAATAEPTMKVRKTRLARSSMRGT
jgi:hypothetical protein